MGLFFFLFLLLFPWCASIFLGQAWAKTKGSLRRAAAVRTADGGEWMKCAPP